MGESTAATPALGAYVVRLTILLESPVIRITYADNAKEWRETPVQEQLRASDTEQGVVAVTAFDVSVRGPRASSWLDEILPFIGLCMLPPLAFCVLVTGLWASYVLIHTLGMIGAWAVCAAPLVILRLALKRRPGVVRRIIDLTAQGIAQTKPSDEQA